MPEKYYVFVSDIHGNLNTLPLIKNAMRDYPDSQLVGGGDYIDSRKNSKEVVEFLMQQQNAVILRGNHEQLMLDFADGKDMYGEGLESLWYQNGGKKTVHSFLGRGYSEKEAQVKIKHSKYYDYFKNLPLLYVTPHIIFVHGGVKPVKNFDDPEIYHDNPFPTPLNSYEFYLLWARTKTMATPEYWYETVNAKNCPKVENTFKQKMLHVFAHNNSGHIIVTGHTPTTFLKGNFADGRKIKTTDQNNCCVRVIKYPNEPARIFTDGGCHSQLRHNFGNVTVLNKRGAIIAVYDYHHPEGTKWAKYVQEKGQVTIYGE